MSTRVSDILGEIRHLEDELEEAIRTHQEEFLYRVEGARVRFEEAARQAHQRLRIGIFRWLGESELRNVASAPFVYLMVVPLVILDAFVSIYQLVCFPLYRIAKVKRSRFIVVDRRELAYLNAIEKLNCVYCGYANGLIAYAREIAARTEQYWCPIKHARKTLDPHRRYARFADFGQGEDYHEHLRAMRASLAETDESEERGQDT
jgi:hypothetical protein